MRRLRHDAALQLPSEGRIAFVPQSGDPGNYWLYIDGTAHSSVNLHDATALDFEYMQQMSVCLGDWLQGKNRVLHLGVGGASMIRWIVAKFPNVRQTGFEIEPVLVDNLRTWLDLPANPVVKLRLIDALSGLVSTSQSSYDVIIRDVFANSNTPQNLRDREFFDHCSRVLRNGGLLLCNDAQPEGLASVRPQLHLLRERFSQVALITEPAVLKKRRYANSVLLATNSEDIHLAHYSRPLGNLAVRSQILTGKRLQRFIDG